MTPDLEFTRRVWMLRVGGTALGLGIIGRLRARDAETSSLPPGLYEPMTDHLGHALESADRFHPVPLGSPTDYVQPSAGPFNPLFFSDPEFAVIRRLTELLLGEETAEGNDKQNGVVEEVAQWIDLTVFSSAGTRQAALGVGPSALAVMAAYHGPGVIQALQTLDEQKAYRDGLAWLENASKSHGNAQFLGLSPEDQKGILKAISDQRIDRHTENSGTRLYTLLKSEVIRGYYTSRVGLKELNYKGNAFYARSPGCSSRP